MQSHLLFHLTALGRELRQFIRFFKKWHIFLFQLYPGKYESQKIQVLPATDKDVHQRCWTRTVCHPDIQGSISKSIPASQAKFICPRRICKPNGIPTTQIDLGCNKCCFFTVFFCHLHLPISWSKMETRKIASSIQWFQYVIHSG